MIVAETSSLVRDKPFYQLGGNLPFDAPSYVRREADVDLLNHLLAGRFCYVLTSRQMGKSSLMVQTAKRLREEGANVATLDLTRIGQNLSPEQWYDGLLIPLGREFNLKKQLDDFWYSSDANIAKMGPMQRWITAVREVILRSVEGRLVIFVDEIDNVRSLPFSTDEFFAGIRQMYNERTIDQELERITFCLLGVAKPSDLIRSVNTTPFNIGQRIVLTYFTETEAEPLLTGLGREEAVSRKLLHRILWWTGGHPYLTQRLCAAVAQDPTVTNSAAVDRICTDIFLSSRAREEDNNLLFVRDVVLRNEADRASLLDMYRQILAGKKVNDDDTSLLVDTLRLAGLIAVTDNRLVVRNRIYAHVFDKQWIQQNMPDAELRRQRRAFRNGLMIAASIAAAVLAVIAFSFYSKEQTELRARQADENFQIKSYTTNMTQAQQEFDAGDFGAGTTLLKEWMVQNEQQPKRWGFEWTWLWARYSGESATTYWGDWDEVRSVATSPNGLIATASADSTVRVFDRNATCTPDATVAPVGGVGVPVEINAVTEPRCQQLKYVFFVDEDALIPLHTGSATSIAEQVRDRLLQSGRRAYLTEPVEGQVQHPLPGKLPGGVWVRFSPDGMWLGVATGYWRSRTVLGQVHLVRVSDGTVAAAVTTSHQGAINAVSLGAGSEMATAGNDNTAEFFKIRSDGTVMPEPDQRNRIYDPGDAVRGTMNALAYSPSGRYVAMAFDDGNVAVKDLKAAGSPVKLMMVDVSGLVSLTFYDDNTILLGCKDGHVWQVDRRNMIAKIMVDTGQGLISDVRVSPVRQPNLMITTGATVRVWRLKRNENLEAWDPVTLRGHRGKVYQADMTPDQKMIVSVGADHAVRFWTRQTGFTFDNASRSSETQELTPSYASHPDDIGVKGVVRAVAFSPLQAHQLVFLRGETEDGHESGPKGNSTEVFFYDLAKRGEPQRLTALRGYGTAIAYSPDGHYVAAGGDHGSITVWDASRPGGADGSTELEPPQDQCHLYCPITGLAFSNDGSLTASKGNAMLHWSRNAGARSLREAFRKDLVITSERKSRGSVAFSPDGQWLAVCTASGADNFVEVWKTGRILGGHYDDQASPDRLFEFQGGCSAVAFSPNSRWLAAGTLSRDLAVWDLQNNWARVQGDTYQIRVNGKIVPFLLPAPSQATSFINSVTFSPDSKVVAYATTDSKIFLWGLADQQSLPTIDLKAGGIWSIAFSPNGNCLAAGSTDGALRLIPSALPNLEARDWIPYGSFWSPCFDAPKH